MPGRCIGAFFEVKIHSLWCLGTLQKLSLWGKIRNDLDHCVIEISMSQTDPVTYFIILMRRC